MKEEVGQRDIEGGDKKIYGYGHKREESWSIATNETETKGDSFKVAATLAGGYTAREGRNGGGH